MKRRPDESFDDYKHRRRVQKVIDKVKAMPVPVWNSKTRGTFRLGQDNLQNSRANANKLESSRQKLERKMKHEQQNEDL